MKTARRRHKVHDLSVLNERLMARACGSTRSTRATALLGDLDALRDLPASPSRPASMCRARSRLWPWFRLVDYSAPGTPTRRLTCRPSPRYARAPMRGDVVYDPLHYPRCWRRSRVPGGAAAGVEARSGLRHAAPSPRGALRPARQAVLRLHEDFPARQVAAAVRDAVKRRLIGFDAVKHLLLARIERRPVISTCRAIRSPSVAATRSADYCPQTEPERRRRLTPRNRRESTCADRRPICTLNNSGALQAADRAAGRSVDA